ncbi:GNAT family N-acetyltransferase [Enterococcus termitis]|uniref:N-acetyltransferase domain-containing protein n=1 Tax=Enterococcus termitis TaxID=332950 RepID=A0A1E5H0V6_9ENTE|nr:GNAT family N-acetyltransferase [Enterococcus termitis]OEG18659.1 hypothetical protein BCR25_15775 [Enterococcus termitis]OJG97618.1 hypothetical protein RV18_GL000686 [Enterococcus termitis]
MRFCKARKKDISKIEYLINSNLKNVVNENQGFVYSYYDKENINNTWCLWNENLLIGIAIVSDFSEINVTKYTITKSKLLFGTAKYISSLCIATEMRGKGIGKMMYSHIFKIFNKANKFYVKVDIDNEVSLRFHKNWKVVGNYTNKKKEKFLLLEKSNEYYQLPFRLIISEGFEYEGF